MKRWESLWETVLAAYRQDYPDLPEAEILARARVLYGFLDNQRRTWARSVSP